MIEAAAKRAKFRALHQSGCFVIPNPWDVGSARLLLHMGFAALATTSSGHAWTMERPDMGMRKADVLKHLREICAAVDLPVNADFESGFAGEPEGVAASVTEAIETGVAGLSIEDTKVDGPGLYNLKFSIERIQAARAAIAHSGQDVMLVARTEGLLHDPAALGPAIEKLAAFAAAGADCLYAPGVKTKADIAAMVKAVAPLPLNVLMTGPGYSLAELAELGVRRISIGGALARVGWNAVRAAAEQLKAGSFDGLATAGSNKPLNDIFASFAGT